MARTGGRRRASTAASGLKFFSVSGHVEAPGVFCVPAGTTIGEVIELAGGMRDGAALGAVQPGGASTNFLGPDCVDVPLTFDAVAKAGSALGTGAMVVMAEGTDLLAAATSVLAFFRNESCGKCVPCRVGSAQGADDPASTCWRRAAGRPTSTRGSTSSRRRCG